jgi:hypothetical protein
MLPPCTRWSQAPGASDTWLHVSAAPSRSRHLRTRLLLCWTTSAPPAGVLTPVSGCGAELAQERVADANVLGVRAEQEQQTDPPVLPLLRTSARTGLTSV